MSRAMINGRRRQRPREEPRWASASEVADYIGVSTVTVANWRRDPAMGFPRESRASSKVGRTDLNEIDKWLRSRVRARVA